MEEPKMYQLSLNVASGGAGSTSSTLMVNTEDQIDAKITFAVNSTLFEDRPVGLNAMFRCQLGGNAFDGHAFAQESWKRVVGEGGAGIIGGVDQTLTSLRRAKDMVKRELKLFEIHFHKYYGRPPSRLDKECLRMLYEYHKQLKAYISAEEAKGEQERQSSKHLTAVGVNPSVGGQVAAAASSSLSAASSSGGGSNRGRSSGGRAEAPRVSSAERPMVRPPVTSDVDLKVLKAEKRALKIKLRRFEEDFVRKNGHKPQSYQEVGSIRDDYTRYKYLKEAVAGS